MESVSDISTCNEYRARAGAMGRAISVAMNREHGISKPVDINSECSDDLFNSTSSSCRGPAAKKRKFNLAEFADSRTNNITNIDEFARYNVFEIDQCGTNEAQFIDDHFAVVKF